MGDTKTVYVLQVMENKTVLPSQIEKALEPDGYQYEGMKVDLCGTVEEKEGAYTFTARGSKQKYTLQPNDDLKKLVKEGKTKLALSGKVTEPEEKDGKKPPPVIEVSSAKEDKK